tara:strand:+ start:665 stop:1042 length:378 start_codon:yes stop_codon:yes gene_type:complete
MSLLSFLKRDPGEKASSVIISTIEKFGGIIMDDDTEHTKRLGGEHVPIYTHGGCGCGCAPEFQFYYDENKLAVMPCGFHLSSPNFELGDKKSEFLANIQSQLKTNETYWIERGEDTPEFLKRYLR